MRAFVVGCILLCSVPVLADAKEFKKKVTAGQTARMWTYHSWNRKCETNTGVVKVVTKPKHGKLTNSIVDSTITTDHWGRAAPCAGKQIKAFRVDYTPDRGFRGTDAFTLDVTWGTTRHDVDTFTVTVE